MSSYNGNFNNILTFINISKEDIFELKKLRRVFVNYKIKTLRNHGETPGSKKMFYNLFDCIISNTLDSNSDYFIVMQSGKELIGFASISTFSTDVVDIPYSYGSIKDFYVSPKHRRKGFGKILNDYIENIFRDNGTGSVLLFPDPVSGIDFWKAMDYCDTGIHQGWGHFLVYKKHLIINDYSEKIDSAISKLVMPTDLIGINPYNRPQIKEAVKVWKKYCQETNRKFRKNDVKKMAFNARKNKAVSFRALYFEGKIIGLLYLCDEIIRYILPEHKNKGFEKELKNEPMEIKKA